MIVVQGSKHPFVRKAEVVGLSSQEATAMAPRIRPCSPSPCPETDGLLTAVAAVCHTHLQLLPLTHVTQSLMRFLVSTRGASLEKATHAQLPNIATWLAKRQHASTAAPRAFREARFLFGIAEAARQGSIELIRAWCVYYGEDEAGATRKIYEVAAREGHVHVLRWLLEIGQLNDHKLVQETAYSSPPVVFWLREQFPELTLTISFDEMAKQPGAETLAFMQYVFSPHESRFHVRLTGLAKSRAAVQGDMAMLAWLQEYCEDACEPWTLRMAAERGHFQVVKWIYDQEYGYSKAFHPSFRIIKNGHFEIFRWLFMQLDLAPLRKYPQQWANEAIAEAVKAGHLESVQLLYPITNKRMDLGSTAAFCGQLPIIQWLLAQGAPCTARAIDLAAINGYLHIIRWLHDQGAGCTTNAMDGAARENFADVVQWLHTNRSEGCTSDAMDQAATNGWLEMVVWLHEHRTEGCTVRAMDGAAGMGHLEVVQWLHQRRSEGCTTDAMDIAAAHGHLHVVEWLHNHRLEGCTPKAMDEAAANGHVDVLQWLHTNRAEGCSTRAMDDAAQQGHLEVVQWLVANHLGNSSPSLLADAASEGHFEVVKWLYATYPDRFSQRLPQYHVEYYFATMYEDPQNLDLVEWLVVHFPQQLEVQDILVHLCMKSALPTAVQ